MKGDGMMRNLQTMSCKNHPTIAVRPGSPLPLCSTCLERWATDQLADLDARGKRDAAAHHGRQGRIWANVASHAA
jgi:hypothetical protein